MSSAVPIIPCPSCQGTGKQPLHEDLRYTLQILKGLKSATVPDVAKAIKWTGTTSAIHNRLEDLRRNGFVKRERQGRWYFYSPANNSQ